MGGEAAESVCLACEAEEGMMWHLRLTGWSQGYGTHYPFAKYIDGVALGDHLSPISRTWRHMKTNSSSFSPIDSARPCIKLDT